MSGQVSGGVVHIAGVVVRVGARIRQRCSWCGALLDDHDLERIAVPEGQDPMPASWPSGDLVAVDGAASWIVPHTDGERLPANACASLDAEATL